MRYMFETPLPRERPVGTISSWLKGDVSFFSDLLLFDHRFGAHGTKTKNVSLQCAVDFLHGSAQSRFAMTFVEQSL